MSVKEWYQSNASKVSTYTGTEFAHVMVDESAMDDRIATREKCGVAELTARATKVANPFLPAAPAFKT